MLARSAASIETITQFLDIVKVFFPREREKKDMAKLFQALRIEVNREMDVLKSLLEQSVQVLAPEGRLAVLTYHSLEDRLVKNYVKAGNFEGRQEKDFYGQVVAPFRAINNKVIVASDAEVNENPRARSAKLRIAEKK